MTPHDGSSELEEVQRRLVECSLVKAADITTKGHIRMQTAFLYPDGSNVDIFIRKRRDLISPVETEIYLTDFGTTISWLANLQVSPLKSKRRKALMQDIIETYGVADNGGSLELRVSPHELTGGLIRLGQACLRLADLYYTSRFVSHGRFNDEVEEVLSDLAVDYEANVAIRGRFGNSVQVDFCVHGRRRDTAILTMPSDKTQYTAKQRAEHVFTSFSDLIEWSGQRIAALDDRAKPYADVDLERISTVATVVPILEDLQSFREALLAA
jgi:hypothetical protein